MAQSSDYAIIHWIWQWRNGSLHADDTWENFPFMPCLVCYAY